MSIVENTTKVGAALELKPEGLTTAEICAETSLSEEMVHRALAVLEMHDTIRPGRRQRPSKSRGAPFCVYRHVKFLGAR